MGLTAIQKRELEKIAQQRQGKRRICFVSGNFNIIHPGHLRLINFASECADYLVVGVFDDEREGVFVPQEHRIQGIKALESVSTVVPICESSFSEFLNELGPDFVVKGKEHENKFNEEQEVLDRNGGRLIFSSGSATYSSRELISRELKTHSMSVLRHPKEYCERHQLGKERVNEIFKNIEDLNVVVFGDLIVDEYINCETLGLSQEDPTIVVTPVLKNKFIGGAGIVASHAASLGGKVNYFTVVGDDDAAQFAKDKLNEYSVDYNFVVDNSRPTTLKTRYRTKEKTLLRVSQLKSHSISDDLVEEMFNSIKTKVESANLLVFSDFNYGCLPSKLINRVIELAIANNVYVVADSQSSSQVGDISRFKNMNLITPTEREARLAVSDFQSGLVVLSRKLQEKSSAKNIMVTMGAEGVLIHSMKDQENSEEFLTDKLPALNENPKDTAGAGDSMLVMTSLAMAAGASIWEAAYLGSIASACQVSRVGNIPLQKSEILEGMSTNSPELQV